MWAIIEISVPNNPQYLSSVVDRDCTGFDILDPRMTHLPYIPNSIPSTTRTTSIQQVERMMNTTTNNEEKYRNTLDQHTLDQHTLYQQSLYQHTLYQQSSTIAEDGSNPTSSTRQSIDSEEGNPSGSFSPSDTGIIDSETIGIPIVPVVTIRMNPGSIPDTRSYE